VDGWTGHGGQDSAVKADLCMGLGICNISQGTAQVACNRFLAYRVAVYRTAIRKTVVTAGYEWFCDGPNGSMASLANVPQ
jgi:hypothetical protein